MQIRVLGPFLGSAASLTLGLAIPIAFPNLGSWIGRAGILLSVVLLVVAVTIRLWPSRFNDRQRQVYLELAQALARLLSIALRFPKGSSWPEALVSQRWKEWNETHENVRRLIEEICYDEDTWKTADDFRQICSFIIADASQGEDAIEHRREIQLMKGPLFRSLHEGKGVNRDKVPVPEWARQNDQRTSKPASPAEKADKRPIQSNWNSLDEALKYLVRDSAWSYTIDINKTSDPQEIISQEFFDAAARGEIKVRGYRKASDYPFRLAAASEEVPRKFWVYAGMQPFFEIYHGETPGHKDSSRPAVWHRRDRFPEAPGGFFGRVTVRAADVQKCWPKAAKEMRSSQSDLSKALESFLTSCNQPDSDAEFNASFDLNAAN